ncbi:MAG: ABC transporter ATP-binding protein [Candidatus Sericytochromatia bacterium]|nr:ABC transporter ATP-binding protein [Candidatus Sericytochromatia bacterium]
MTGRALVAEGLACGHGGQPVLSGVSAMLPAGAFVGLLGPNGVGKSTLLATLAGLLPPLAGAVWLGGEPLAGLTPRELARRRAYLPQHPPAELAWRVEEAVAIGRFPHQRGWGLVQGATDRAAVARALRAAGVEALAERRLATLSGGQRQRVHLARALAQEAPLLFLDEPTTHLDLTHQLAFYQVVRELATTAGLTVVAVLHDLNLAAQFCHRLLLLGSGPEGGAGELLADGPPAAVLDPLLVARAFGQAVQVRHHPQTGLPYVLPVVPEGAAPRGSGRLRGRQVGRLHLVCGGGSAERLLPPLYRAGWQLSVGVVNALDTDEVLAARLGAEVIAEAPFSPVGLEAAAALAERLDGVDLVVVAEVAWGSGNVENLRRLRARLDRPSPPRVLLLGGEDLPARDFTGGQARALWASLQAAGAEAVTPEALLRMLA